jgi:hypothetical protein
MKKLIYTLVILTLAVSLNAQWVQVTNGISATANIYSLAAIGSNIFAGNDNGVYLSTNNGTSWTITALNNKLVYSLATLGTVIYAGTSSSGVYSSTNNGANWTQTSLNNQTVYALTISGNSIFAGASGNGVYLSTNNGTNWTQNSLSSHSVISLAASGANIYAGTSLNGIYRSTNSGANWAQTSMNFSSLKSLAIGSSYYFAGAYSLTGSNGFYRSTDGGTWTLVGLNSINVLCLTVSGNNVFAGTDNGVYLSTNNGTNWILKNQGITTVPHIESILIANTYIFIGTNGESVWRRTLAESIGISNISTEIPSSYSLSQNYPNPFNPATTIKFALTKNDYTSIKVFDMLGKEVATLVNEKLNAGTYSVDWNASDYPSGVYFYCLKTKEFTDTKRMILIK